MVLPESAISAADVADALTDALPPTIHSTARQLYRALVWVAVETTRRRGHSPATTEAVFHLPLEQIARAVGVHRATIWRHLPALRELGLVDFRTHKGALRGETRNTGTVWRIRMSPVRGPKARLNYDDLKHPWRNLDADVRRGRTSYRALQDDVQHTEAFPQNELTLQGLLRWTLPPVHSKNPVTAVCCMSERADLESVLDVSFADKKERARAVSLGAQALAVALRDYSSLDWYRKLLWQLLRRSDATGEDHLHQVYEQARRARTDAQEGFARRPGALFISRLKGASWFDAVMNAPPVRVGMRSARA